MGPPRPRARPGRFSGKALRGQEGRDCRGGSEAEARYDVFSDQAGVNWETVVMPGAGTLKPWKPGRARESALVLPQLRTSFPEQETGNLEPGISSSRISSSFSVFCSLFPGFY